MSNNISQNARLRHAPDSAWRMIDGQAVIINSTSQRMRVLNDVGSRVWELVDGRTLAEVVQTIQNEFDAEPAQIDLEVEEFVHDLVERGMLCVGEGA
jgi:hypothetical protein